MSEEDREALSGHKYGSVPYYYPGAEEQDLVSRPIRSADRMTDEQLVDHIRIA